MSGAATVAVMPEAVMPDDLSRELATLASGLCQDAGLKLEVRGEVWAFDPARRLLSVPHKALEAQGRDGCAGQVANEVGHCWLTRHDLFWIQFPSAPVCGLLMDALEDARVDAWMRARYPGVRPWQEAVPRRLPDKPLPNVVLFAYACAIEGGGGSLPWVPARVAEALAQTRAARQHYATLLPATEVGGAGPSSAQPEGNPRRRSDVAYRERVWPELRAPSGAVSPFEAEVQLLALEALEVARAAILPVAAALYQEDLASLAAWLAANPDALQELDGQCLRGEAPSPSLCAQALGDGRPFGSTASAAALRGARRLLEALGAGGRALARVPVRGVPLAGGLPGLSGLPMAAAEARPWEGRREPLRLPPTTLAPYDEALSKVGDQIEQLVAHLDRVLRPRQRLREREGYPSGRRVHLPSLMAFDADPRRVDELWVRSTIPERRRVVFSLLIDLSGSMQGERASAALLGTVLLAETLARLRIPFAIDGFQDVLVPFSAFYEPFGPGIRNAIAGMVDEVSDARPGGNNRARYNDDGPCVLDAANALLGEPAEDRILIVVSDGAPAGERSNADDLRSTVRALGSAPIQLLGLGLGPDTEHVASFYPRSVSSIPLARFAEEIGGLIERGLGANRDT